VSTSDLAVARVTTTTTATPKRRLNWRRIGAWAAMAILLFVTIFPFYWVVRTALSTNKQLAPASDSITPVGLTLGGFKRALGLQTLEEAQAEGGSGAAVNFATSFRNSLIYATILTAGQVTFSTMAAYAFARMRFKGSNLLFAIVLAALMVPGIFTTLPNFVLIKDLGGLDTFWGMAAPGFFMAPFAIFFMRQFFLGISKEVEESAKLDGATNFKVFRSIIVPISAAPIATLALLTFINTWNDYFWPFLIGKGQDTRVLTVALGVFKAQTPGGSPDWSGLMAATVVSVAPMVLLLILFGKRIVNSVQFSGIK
jgi:multiple sugar transport system permease protein